MALLAVSAAVKKSQICVADRQISMLAFRIHHMRALEAGASLEGELDWNQNGQECETSNRGAMAENANNRFVRLQQPRGTRKEGAYIPA